MTEMGDDEYVPCPWCEKDQCIQDFAIDGVLDEGYKFSCDDCGKKIIISGVDYRVRVYVDRVDDVTS